MDINVHIEEWVENYKPGIVEYQYDKSETMRGVLLVFGKLGVSIQWGAGTYSDNYEMYWDAKTPPSYTAEAAIWYMGGGLGYYLIPSSSPIRTANLIMLPCGDTVTYKSYPDDIEEMIVVCRDYARA